MFAVAGPPGTRNNFVRTNPDGSQWVHFQAVNVQITIMFTDLYSFFVPLFSGSGKITGTFTVEDWTADLRRFEWRWEGTLAEEGTDDEYPFLLHVVAKDGVYLQNDVLFAPLGLGD